MLRDVNYALRVLKTEPLTMPRLQRGRKRGDFIEETTLELAEILLILQKISSNATLVSSAVTIIILLVPLPQHISVHLCPKQLFSCLPHQRAPKLCLPYVFIAPTQHLALPKI